MKNRRSFLKIACKPLVLAALSIPVLEACSSEETSNNPIIGSSSNETPTEPLVINIADGLFADLLSVGGWINYTAKNLLLIRISEAEVRAFDNSCPHQGNRDRWSLNGAKFECGYHNNSYSTECSGSLKCYTATLEDTTLTVTF